MRNKLLLIFLFSIAICLNACKKESFLKATDLTNLNVKTVFADSAKTISFLGDIYAQTGFTYIPTQFGTAGLEAASDEAYGYSTSASDAYQQFANGTVNSTNITSAPYETCYKNIRACNVFLKNIRSSKMNSSVKSHAIGEAHFLRAWFYAILLKYYGGVVIVGDNVYTASDEINDKRSSYAACVNYIVAECNTAQNLMGFLSDPKYYGRASSWACVALKARVLLYAASPLFNMGNIQAGNVLTGYPTDSLSPALIKQRWKRAAIVADSIINGGSFSLFNTPANSDSINSLPGHNFKLLFFTGTQNNEESIFVQGAPYGFYYLTLWLPPSRLGTQHAWPFEETVEAFGMKNGKQITDPSSGYDPNNPYANRDPRLDFSILHNNELLIKQVTPNYSDFEPLETYVGATTGDGINNGTPTGYYIFKQIADGEALGAAIGFSIEDYILLRYGEVLLNYAEAENEYLDAPDKTVYTALTLIRARAGIAPGSDGNYGLTPGMTQSQMRTVIQNERRVELAYESHRFFDVRRWKIAEQTDNQVMHGMKITKQPNGSFTYQIVPVATHVFNTAMYFWPIPQVETQKSSQMIQNPGYER